MNSWDVTTLNLQPHAPQILSSTEDARAIAIEIPAGEALTDHQVHERAWIAVLQGEVDVTTSTGQRVAGGPGLVAELSPGERHALHARTNARILLLLTPWPGAGHPGAMTLENKVHVRDRAAESRFAE